MRFPYGAFVYGVCTDACVLELVLRRLCVRVVALCSFGWD